jgi:hypothetical protein
MVLSLKEVSSSIQFIGAIVLVIAAGVVRVLQEQFTSRAHDSNNQSYEHLSMQSEHGISIDTMSPINNLNEECLQDSVENSTPPTKQYFRKPRLLFWIKQASLFSYLLLYALSSFQYYGENDGSMFYISHGSYWTALLIVLCVDDLLNLANEAALRLWLWVYGIILLHSIINCICNQDGWSILLLLNAAVTLFAAVICYTWSESLAQMRPPTLEYTCGLLSALSFSYLNSILIAPGMKKTAFEFEEDVPTLSDADSAAVLWEQFRDILLETKHLNLWYSLYLLVKWEWYAQGCFQLMGSMATYITPLALERILLHIANKGSDDDDIKALIPINIYLAVFMMLLGPLVSGVCDGQNYVRGRCVCV